MECNACGRYMPSATVLPVLDRDGGMQLACPDCRLRDRPGSQTTSVVLPALVIAPTHPAVPATP